MSEKSTGRSGDKQWSGVALYGTLLLYYSYVLYRFSRVDRDPPPHLVEEFRPMKKFRYCYLTTWNFVIQVNFILLAIAADLLKWYAPRSPLSRAAAVLRRRLFLSILFPSTLLVASVFWTMFLYNRELILPAAVDVLFPPWLNQSLHSAIIVPLLIEVYLLEDTRPFRTWRALRDFTAYIVVYEAVYFFIYFKYGVFLYPLYKVFSWTQLLVFSAVSYLSALVYATIGVHLNNRKCQRKSKAR